MVSKRDRAAAQRCDAPDKVRNGERTVRPLQLIAVLGRHRPEGIGLLSVVALAALATLLTASCYRPCASGPIPLFGPLSSHQSPQQARETLGSVPWSMVQEDKGPADGRPRFDFVRIDVGEMVDHGHTGGVQLFFYNDRLMSVFFTPRDPGGYFKAIRSLPGATITDNGRVVIPSGARAWRVGAAQDGPIIEWFDECLRDEHNSWLSQYS